MIHTNTHTHIQTYTHTWAPIHICTRTYTHAHFFFHTHTHTLTHPPAHTQTRNHKLTHTCEFAHVFTRKRPDAEICMHLTYTPVIIHGTSILPIARQADSLCAAGSVSCLTVRGYRAAMRRGPRIPQHCVASATRILTHTRIHANANTHEHTQCWAS